MSGREEMIMEDRRRALRNYWGLPARRSLVFVHPFEAVADCFVHALEQEYPSLAVEFFIGWNSLPARFEHPIALALIDSRLWESAEYGLRSLRAAQSSLPYAVVCDDMRNVSTLASDFAPDAALRGLLPMNVKLDLWLSIIGLMLQGGDYYPPSLFKTLVAKSSTVPTAPEPQLENGNEAFGPESPLCNDLTGRERQVLAFVAKGAPNKVVAVELGLSEHTVKIHIHNIIRKLHVHNRTEAAAIYLRGMTTRTRHLP